MHSNPPKYSPNGKPGAVVPERDMGSVIKGSAAGLPSRGMAAAGQGGSPGVDGAWPGASGVSGLRSISQPANEPGKPKRLDQVRAKLRLLHYSIRTDYSYLRWIDEFLRFEKNRLGQWRIRARWETTKSIGI